MGGKGLEITLPGYSYAEDALLIYNAIEKWVDGYVSLYYQDDVAGKKVNTRLFGSLPGCGVSLQYPSQNLLGGFC